MIGKNIDKSAAGDLANNVNLVTVIATNILPPPHHHLFFGACLGNASSTQKYHFLDHHNFLFGIGDMPQKCFHRLNRKLLL